MEKINLLGWFGGLFHGDLTDFWYLKKKQYCIQYLDRPIALNGGLRRASRPAAAAASAEGCGSSARFERTARRGNCRKGVFFEKTKAVRKS